MSPAPSTNNYDATVAASMHGAGARRTGWTLFVLLFALGLGWSFSTRHVWEDFYITYRASKNLATGHGLTFTVGERVHSFTSPLGVLLPALASLATGNRSDTAALWIFRLWSLAAYAGTGVFLWHCGVRLFSRVWPTVFLVLMYACDAKIVDFTVNGMETPYVLLFLTWTLYALFCAPARPALHLGLAWAGLMWCRPDSFIYIGALGIGALAFGSFSPFWSGRWRWIKTCLLAAGLTTLLYAPWLAWAWRYYGSPIPHTVVAKGLLSPHVDVPSLVRWLADFPGAIKQTGAGLNTTFMPPYADHVGWPPWALQVSFWVSLVVLVLWVVPFVRREARVASFGFFVGQFYLTYIARAHSPWYVPTLTLLAIVALAGLIETLAGGFGRHAAPAPLPHPRTRPWLVGLTALLPAGALVLLVCTAWQMRLSQRIVEDGNRRPLGEWLAVAAKPTDTVFLECLGYIGFYSGLKMYDYPGLSSPEVVAARRTLPARGDYKDYFADLIARLRPDWVVLRPPEVFEVDQAKPQLLSAGYKLVKVFDVRRKVDALRFVPGRGYLEFDACFQVFRRIDDLASAGTPPPVPITLPSLTVNRTYTGPAIEKDGIVSAHMPSLLAVEVPPGSQWISGRFGIAPGAYKDADHRTHGAIFRITLVDPAGVRTVLFERVLTPYEERTHRVEQRFAVDLPPGHPRTVEFTADPLPGKDNAYGWTYWSALQFESGRPDRASGTAIAR